MRGDRTAENLWYAIAILFFVGYLLNQDALSVAGFFGAVIMSKLNEMQRRSRP
jgi:hypothetical protein